MGGGASVWVYEGGLYDVLNGKKIAHVEGVELVRHLASSLPSSTSTDPISLEKDIDNNDNDVKDDEDEGERLGDLRIRQLLFGATKKKQQKKSRRKKSNEDTTTTTAARATSSTTKSSIIKNAAAATSSWDFASTILSRKMFCYRSPTSSCDFRMNMNSNDDDVSHNNSNEGSGNIDNSLPASSFSSPHQLLRAIKLYPNSPLRRIPVDQSVALYDTATTYVSRRNGTQLVVHTEWPDGRCVMGSVESDELPGNEQQEQQQEPKQKTLSFHVHPKSVPLEQHELPPLAIRSEKNNAVVSSPPRSKWVQFGSDNKSSSGGPAATLSNARETYTFTYACAPTLWANKDKGALSLGLSSLRKALLSRLRRQSNNNNNGGKNNNNDKNNDHCRVHYTRYGEGPPFYGPNRMCTLELWGRRVSSIAEAPPLTATVAASRVPGFLSVNTPIVSPSKQEPAQAEAQAVRWFRGKDGAIPLTLLSSGDDDDDDDSDGIDNGTILHKKLKPITNWTTRKRNQGWSIYERIKSATTITSLEDE